MKTIIEIPVASIDANGRVRPVTQAVAEQFARDMTERGQRTPIEVKRTGKGKWKLVDGAHRLAAVKLLHGETIEAVEVKGTTLEIQRDELLAQLMHSELSKLERAQFLARFKAIFQDLHPETRAGGDRKTAERIKSQTLRFDQVIAARSPWAERTIQISAEIGELLSAEAVSFLRGTPFEDKQKDLEAISKLSPKTQVAVVKLLTAGKDAAPSVAAALEIVEGRTAVADDGKAMRRLVERWGRMPKAQRREWVLALGDDQAEELAELLDERARSGRLEEAA